MRMGRGPTEPRPNPRPPAPSAPGRLDLSGRSVLIVEDDDDSRDMLQQMVQSFGASISAAKYGREAIELATAVCPDLVLCDLVMPGVSGFHFMEWLRRQTGRLRHVPVIAVTALGSEADFSRTFEAGFTGHLLKPVDYAAIEAQLRRVFTRTLADPRA